MLIDNHRFLYPASVPWPCLTQDQKDWELGVRNVKSWLDHNVGKWMQHWAWTDSHDPGRIGVAFCWDQDRLLFVLQWST